MYILVYFDWFGDIKELEELDNKWKELYDGSDGVEWLGRYGPHNKKLHWVYFYKVKDLSAWANRKPQDFYKRDYNVLTHNIIEYFTG
jgi:hypothetical protein